MSKFSKKIVTLVILLNVAFTIAVLYCFLRVGSEPTTLIAAWFAFTTGELWMLASIKKTKVKAGEVSGTGFEFTPSGSQKESGTADTEV